MQNRPSFVTAAFIVKLLASFSPNEDFVKSVRWHFCEFSVRVLEPIPNHASSELIESGRNCVLRRGMAGGRLRLRRVGDQIARRDPGAVMSATDLIAEVSKTSFALFCQLLGQSRKTVWRRISFMMLMGILICLGSSIFVKLLMAEIDSRNSQRSAEQSWAIEDAFRFRALSAIDDCIGAMQRKDPEVVWYCDEAKWSYTQVVWPTPQQREQEIIKREVYWAMRSDLLMQEHRADASRKAAKPERWERAVDSLSKFEWMLTASLLVLIPYLLASGALYWGLGRWGSQKT